MERRSLFGNPSGVYEMRKTLVYFLAAHVLSGCMICCESESRVSLDIVRLSTPDWHVTKSPYACEVKEGEDGRGLKMNIDFFVVFRNNTQSTFAFSSEEFSFGYYDLSLEIMSEKGEVAVLTKQPGLVWWRNYLDYLFVASGDSIAYPVTLDPRVWRGIPDWLWKDGLNYRVRAKFSGGYLLDGEVPEGGPMCDVGELGKPCGELQSEWKRLRFR